MIDEHQTREVWLPVLQYEGIYEVSNLGRVRRDMGTTASRNTWPGRLLQPVQSNEYWIVSLSKDGAVKNHALHRLVLSSFCGAEPFDGAQACHNDGDPNNNALSNLRWDSALGNQADVDRHGNRCRGEDVFGARLTERDVVAIRELIAAGLRNRPIAERYGVSISTIHLIRHERIWRHVA